MAILDIRGTHGSGKSHIIHNLLDVYDYKYLIEAKKKIGILVPELDAAILGTYDRVCGGCDGIKTPEEVCRRVHLLSRLHRNVLLEGILVAHTRKRYNQLASEVEEQGRGPYQFLFLDTPLRTCVARVRARQSKKMRVYVNNNGSGQEQEPVSEFDPKNVIKDWHCIWQKVQAYMREQGRSVHIVNYRDPMPKVFELLD